MSAREIADALIADKPPQRGLTFSYLLSLLTISAYRSAWLAIPTQLRQRFLRTWAAASLCGKPSKRRHSWA
jgi:hypothetical protein